MLGEEAISSVPRLRAGLFSDLSAWDSYPLRILDCVELRVPPLISHEKNGTLSPVTSEKASSLSSMLFQTPDRYNLSGSSTGGGGFRQN